MSSAYKIKPRDKVTTKESILIAEFLKNNAVTKIKTGHTVTGSQRFKEDKKNEVYYKKYNGSKT
jgi:hypothetical protein|tara:strand:+ start:400 stop:591 length:192 start_codon:yes stop_codon:yes gene_type:complete